MTEQSIAPRV